MRQEGEVTGKQPFHVTLYLKVQQQPSSHYDKDHRWIWTNNSLRPYKNKKTKVSTIYYLPPNRFAMAFMHIFSFFFAFLSYTTFYQTPDILTQSIHQSTHNTIYKRSNHPVSQEEGRREVEKEEEYYQLLGPLRQICTMRTIRMHNKHMNNGSSSSR